MPSTSEIQSFLKKKRIVVFIGTFYLYSSFHSARTGYSFVKNDIHDPEQQGFSERQLALMDFCFMICYSVSLALSGHFLDRFSVKKIVTIGVVGSSLSFFFLSFLGLIESKTVWFFGLSLGLSGVFQGSGYPSSTGIIGKWWNKKKRGRVFGLWSLCENTGNLFGFFIIGTLFTNWWLQILTISGVISFSLCYYPFSIDPSPEYCKKNSEFRAALAKFISEEGKKKESNLKDSGTQNQSGSNSTKEEMGQEGKNAKEQTNLNENRPHHHPPSESGSIIKTLCIKK